MISHTYDATEVQTAYIPIVTNTNNNTVATNTNNNVNTNNTVATNTNNTVINSTIPYTQYLQDTNQQSTIDCTIITKIITSSFWKKCFPSSYMEVEYSCTSSLLIDMIERKTGQILTIHQLREQLWKSYEPYLETNPKELYQIIIQEGKKIIGDQLKSGILSLQQIIMTEHYFLTTLDIWSILVKYEIPCFFISQTSLYITDRKRNAFLAFGNPITTEKEHFAFIVVSGMRPEHIPTFKQIKQGVNDDYNIPLTIFDKTTCSSVIVDAINEYTTINSYIQSFKKFIYTSTSVNTHIKTKKNTNISNINTANTTANTTNENTNILKNNTNANTNANTNILNNNTITNTKPIKLTKKVKLVGFNV